VQDLPDQSTQPVGDGADGLGMSEARHEPTIHHGEDGAPGLDGGIGGLVEDAAHLAIAFRAPVTVVLSGAFLGAGARAHPRGEVLR
jgi:hypothetical protein